MEPLEFCKKWVKSPALKERGYYKEYVRVLAKATGLSERTIQGWGANLDNRPEYILTSLRNVNAILEIREAIKQSELINFPSD